MGKFSSAGEALGIVLSKSGLLALSLFVFAACNRAATAEKPDIIEVPKLETVNAPITAPEPKPVPMPVVISLGVQSMPKDIDGAPSAIQDFGKAVAKVMRADGASGSGFFISPDGIFITNEHVIPRSSCTPHGCPGIKIVLGFTKQGKPQVFSKFRVLLQDNGDREYDFTVLKVALQKGETVPFLRLETDEANYRFGSDTEVGRYIALGHPGGATLQYTETRPIEKSGNDIVFQGLMIGGNSGGPLIDSKTGTVVGLDKETRDSFIRINSETAVPDKENRATAMRDLVVLLKTEDPSEISTIKGLDSLHSATKSGVYAPEQTTPTPTVDILSGALRRTLSDAKLRSAMSSLDLYVGTSRETSTLDLMLRQDEYTPGPLTVDALTELFHKQLLIGRPLRFSVAAQALISAALALKDGEETSSKMTAAILFNYFDDGARIALQKKCLSAFPGIPAAAAGAISVCASLTAQNGSSLVVQAVNTLKLATYGDVEDFGPVTGLFLFADILGSQKTEDIQAVIDLDKIVTEKNSDIESFLQSDSYAMGFAKGLVGIGSFTETYPQ